MALPAFVNHPHRRPICPAKVAPFHPAGHQSHAVLAPEPIKTVNAEQTSSPTAPSVLASYILRMHVHILTIGRLESFQCVRSLQLNWRDQSMGEDASGTLCKSSLVFHSLTRVWFNEAHKGGLWNVATCANSANRRVEHGMRERRLNFKESAWRMEQYRERLHAFPGKSEKVWKGEMFES